MWPWRRRRRFGEEAVRRAREVADNVLREERRRLEEAARLAARLAAHRERNNFAAAIADAFGRRR